MGLLAADNLLSCPLSAGYQFLWCTSQSHLLGRPFSILNPLRGCTSDSAQYANTPSPRFFEGEDDDENEYDSKRLVMAGSVVGVIQV
jgi:hypothetical protein